MSQNLSDILKQLDTISVENSIEVYVPSIKTSLKFKPLNLRQQKELLKTTIDDSLIKLAFNNILTEIILENATDASNLINLYTFDRTAIALCLRAKSLSEFIDIDDKKINLLEKVEENKTINVDLSSFDKTITTGNLTIKLCIPTLAIDKEINTYVLNRIKATQTTDIKTIIGDLVVYEIAKFINSITFSTGENTTNYVFSQQKIQDRISLIEKFPSTLTNSIFDHVKGYRTLESKYTQFENTTIDIDGNFFTV
jgi:hypothetical protein